MEASDLVAAVASRHATLPSGSDESARRTSLQWLSRHVNFSHLCSSPMVVLEFVRRIPCHTW